MLGLPWPLDNDDNGSSDSNATGDVGECNCIHFDETSPWMDIPFMEMAWNLVMAEGSLKSVGSKQVFLSSSEWDRQITGIMSQGFRVTALAWVATDLIHWKTIFWMCSLYYLYVCYMYILYSLCIYIYCIYYNCTFSTPTSVLGSFDWLVRHLEESEWRLIASDMRVYHMLHGHFGTHACYESFLGHLLYVSKWATCIFCREFGVRECDYWWCEWPDSASKSMFPFRLLLDAFQVYRGWDLQTSAAQTLPWLCWNRIYDYVCIYNIRYNLCNTQIHCQWAHLCHKDKMGVCGVLSQWRIACHVHCSTRPLSFIFPLLTMSRSRPASVFRVWHNTGLDFLKPVLSRMRLQSGQDAINIHQLETFV